MNNNARAELSILFIFILLLEYFYHTLIVGPFTPYDFQQFVWDSWSDNYFFFYFNFMPLVYRPPFMMNAPLMILPVLKPQMIAGIHAFVDALTFSEAWGHLQPTVLNCLMVCMSFMTYDFDDFMDMLAFIRQYSEYYRDNQNMFKCLMTFIGKIVTLNRRLLYTNMASLLADALILWCEVIFDEGF